MKLKIKEQIKNKGFTVREFAEKFPVTERMVYHWLSGKKHPSFSSTVRICEILGCELKDLYEE